jgi:threonine synthase
MIYYSTRHQADNATLQQAVLRGLAPDGGLYMPSKIESLPAAFYGAAPGMSFHAIALRMAEALLGDDVPVAILERIVEESFDFEVPVLPLEPDTFVLELFHGPTLAFKDFAARFMARLMGYFVAGSSRELHILVATSGDTGSAVAHGFRGVEGIRVHVLFPKGRVSAVQEAQLTTAGGNVAALEVEGSFDDCQALVKSAFLDLDVRAALNLSSANSINIARLFPQSFYYCWAWSRVSEGVRPVVISVPCGNFGNLTAGLIARRMGLPVSRFIAATNVNDSVPVYLQTREWRTRPVVATISNAMDVASPSNWERILDLYSRDADRLGTDLTGWAFDDDATRGAIREVRGRYGYVADPHGAIGWLGLERYRAGAGRDAVGVFLETAHPAKFPDVVEKELGISVEIPAQAKEALAAPKRAIRMPARFDDFKQYLLQL